MPSTRKPIAETVAACRERLAAAGFKKRSGEIFTFDRGNEVLGWLGLNRAVGRGDGALEINPVVGVRHQAIERMVADLKDEKFHAYAPPTLSVHLGYVMPQKRYQPWLFLDTNVPEMADSMVRAVEEYGLPFMREHSTLQQLLASMVSGNVGVREHLAYRVPIGYRRLGDGDRAKAAVEMALLDLGDRQDAAAQRFRRFAARFEAPAPPGTTEGR